MVKLMVSKATSQHDSYLVSTMTTVEVKQLLKLAQTVKYAHDVWSSYLPKLSYIIEDQDIYSKSIL